MYKRNIFIFMAVALALLNVSTFSREVTKTGTTAAKFLSIGIGPRAISMGSAFSSIANDASAMYWNPAGTATLTQSELMVTYTKLFADINVEYLGLAIPAGELGSFGLSVTAVPYGEMEVTDEYNPEGTGEYFSAASYAVGLNYARSITENFIVGLNIKYIREDIRNSSASGVAFDIGTIFTTPFYGVKFASSITNYGTKMQMAGEDLLVRHDPDRQRAGNNETVNANYETDEFDLPLRLQIGLSKDFQFLNNQRLTVAVDAGHPNDNRQYVNVGGELALFDNMIFFRGGYKSLFQLDSQEGLTLGFGLNYGGLGALGVSLDYAYQNFEKLGDTHSFGVMLKF